MLDGDVISSYETGPHWGRQRPANDLVAEMRNKAPGETVAGKLFREIRVLCIYGEPAEVQKSRAPTYEYADK
jgi:hypothetical protein